MIALKEKSTSKQRLTREKAHYQFIPELNDLPYLKAQFKNQCFSRHVHEGYCIGVIEEGAQRFYRSGGNHIASENCIILVNADQVHDGQTATDNGWRYKAVYPTGDMFNEVIREYTQGADMPLFKSPVVSDRALAIQLRQLFTLFESTEDPIAVQSAYLNVMNTLISRHASGYDNLRKITKNIAAAHQICDYLNDNLHRSVSSEELSKLTGLNPYYLIRSFQKTVGLPPHAWQIQQRLHKATELLKSGSSATHAGLSVGFNDQSHFNRHFVKMWGTTPGRFQKAWQAQ